MFFLGTLHAMIRVSEAGERVPGVSGPAGGVWVGPCRCRVLHHLIGFVADFFGVFCVAGTGRSGMCIVVVAQAVRVLWSFESLKNADISTCQQFSSVSGLRGSKIKKIAVYRFLKSFLVPELL